MKIFCYSFAFIAIHALNLFACTGISLRTKDWSLVTGRTVEFGISLDMSVAVIPRNYPFIGQSPYGQGKKYRSKYAAVGVYCFSNQILMDGMNEKGLVAAAFYFPGYATYTPVSQSNKNRALSPVDFSNWILSQFATVEEVIDAIENVVITPTRVQDWGDTPPPMHYIVYDKSGKCIVIEPLDHALVIYRNTIGVITNSPPFDWHLQNLNNYINLTPDNISSYTLRGKSLSPFGQGSGMLGLPGDFTPPSRFVRAALFSSYALPKNTSEELVFEAFHILNQFDIPLGSVRHKEKGKVGYDTTELTIVKDSATLKYYYKSYKDQTIKSVDLHQFDLNDSEIRSMKISGKQQSIDISSELIKNN